MCHIFPCLPARQSFGQTTPAWVMPELIQWNPQKLFQWPLLWYQKQHRHKTPTKTNKRKTSTNQPLEEKKSEKEAGIYKVPLYSGITQEAVVLFPGYSSQHVNINSAALLAQPCRSCLQPNEAISKGVNVPLQMRGAGASHDLFVCKISQC